MQARWDNHCNSDRAMRLENAISKYFIERFELFSPCNIYEIFVRSIKEIYWGTKRLERAYWFHNFKKKVSVKKMSLFEGYTQFDALEFQTSSQFLRLTTLFPIVHEWTAKKIDWLDLRNGTCFGESLVAMKYKNRFNMQQGFLGFHADDKMHVKNQVILIQAIHEIQNIFSHVLKHKREMENRRIPTVALTSHVHQVHEARLFHFLRKCGTSRFEARYLCSKFSDLFLYSSQDLTLAHASCDQALREAVNSFYLSEIFTNEKGYQYNTQKVLDNGVCNFLSHRSGCFTLICGGDEKIGHAMFLKMENGKCFTYDSSKHISFITPQTPDGILKTIELMKKILIKPNLGGNLFYKVMAIDS